MLREFWRKIEKFADISTVFFLLHSGIVGMPIFTDAAPFFGCTAKNGGQDLNDKKIERILEWLFYSWTKRSNYPDPSLAKLFCTYLQSSQQHCFDKIAS